MCRLYGLQSTHATKVGCELIEAQNSLIRQSVEDERGLSNPHGWGVGSYRDGALTCERQVGPASESEAFRRYAATIEAPTLLAHVRRATLGGAAQVNTHPFAHGESLLAHNGHIDHFELVRERMFEEMPEKYETAVKGATDSEHFFLFLRWRRDDRPGTEMRHILREAIRDVRRWAREESADAEVALNVLWTEGENLAGSRFGRSLWILERRQPRRCSVCGQRHAEPNPGDRYYAVELASERVTSEDWTEVPENSVFDVGSGREFALDPIDE